MIQKFTVTGENCSKMMNDLVCDIYEYYSCPILITKKITVSPIQTFYDDEYNKSRPIEDYLL